MNKKNNDKYIKSLDSEIQFVQIENFINKFDNSMKKHIIKKLKRVLIMLGPSILLISSYFIFNNTILLMVGLSIASVGTIAIKIIDEKNKNDLSKKEKDIKQILNEGIDKKEEKDFYTEEYKILSEKQKTHSNLRLVENKIDILDKEKTMIQVIKELDAYCSVYNIPILTITSEDWDIFFDIMYNVFIQKGIEDKFYNCMSRIGRITFSKSLVNKNSNIGINDFIDNLCYLNTKYGNFEIDIENINEKEIYFVQNQIKEQIRTSKIINFQEYIKQKKIKR